MSTHRGFLEWDSSVELMGKSRDDIYLHLMPMRIHFLLSQTIKVVTQVLLNQSRTSDKRGSVFHVFLSKQVFLRDNLKKMKLHGNAADEKLKFTLLLVHRIVLTLKCYTFLYIALLLFFSPFEPSARSSAFLFSGVIDLRHRAELVNTSLGP